jgi:hypothetical protein
MVAEDKRFTAQDLLVALASAGFGAPFCGAAAKAALDGNTTQAIVGFVVGLPMIGFGAAFPFMKDKLSSIARIWISVLSAVSLLSLFYVPSLMWLAL